MAKVKKLPTRIAPRTIPQPAPRLTQEQEILGGMFGGGDGCVLGGKDGMGLPEMNHSLTPGQIGDDGTADMFGFGRNSERSGLF